MIVFLRFCKPQRCYITQVHHNRYLVLASKSTCPSWYFNLQTLGVLFLHHQQHQDPHGLSIIQKFHDLSLSLHPKRSSFQIMLGIGSALHVFYYGSDLSVTARGIRRIIIFNIMFLSTFCNVHV